VALAICCLTARANRAAAALAPLRDIADEIVVAVDASGGEQDLTPLGGVADQIFRIELDGFLETALAWLHAQCSADWILRVDDDEVLSAGLLEELPKLMQARDVVQYWLARRWLHPDAAHWLDQWPWFPDFQGRLVRNDARLWFPGLCHSSVALSEPARYLDSGLYHLVHLLSDREERERRVERYLKVDPALRATAADPDLSSYYLPELHPGARLAPVASRDLHAIDEALALSLADRPTRAATSGGQQAPPAVQHATRGDVRAHWAERDLDEAAYRATIRPLDVHRQLVAGDHRPFRVCVTNEGSERWPGGEDRRPLIRAAYRWLTPRGEVFEGEGFRTALPHPLEPGESCVVAMNMTAPSVAGRYLLEPDLVHEHVRWFHCRSATVAMLITAPVAATG
jgi:hypothetical protein